MVYSNIERLQQNPLSYTNEDDDRDCAVIEINNKNFNKLALTKIPIKIKQDIISVEKSFVVVSAATKVHSQLNHPIRC